jgi:hypothetical protein
MCKDSCRLCEGCTNPGHHGAKYLLHVVLGRLEFRDGFLIERKCIYLWIFVSYFINKLVLKGTGYQQCERRLS